MRKPQKKAAQSLTDKRIARLVTDVARKGERVRTRDASTPGLYLEVRSASNAFWLFRYERGGKECWMGLGAYPTFKLSEARERARLARQKLTDGIDPLASRRREVAAEVLAAARTKTFQEAAAEFYDQHSKNWKNAKHRAQFTSTLETYAYPVIGKMLVSDIDSPDVERVLKPIWSRIPETANRLRGRIEQVLDFAQAKKWRTGDNPARWKGNLKTILGANKKSDRHFAAIHYKDLPAFMTELAKREGVSSRALEVLILTATRTGEIIGATWDEIDLDEKLWVIPKERMKAEREHRVPLSERAISLLKKLPKEKGNRHVFIGPKPGRGLSNMAMLQLIDRMGLKGKATTHGFRSCFIDFMTDMRAYPREMREMALAHQIGDETEKAYRRSDMLAKRFHMMNDWADYCYSPPVKDGSNVTPLRRGAK